MSVQEPVAILSERLFVTLSTDVAHIADENGNAICGEREYDLDRIKQTQPDVVIYGTQYFGIVGLIHPDDRWRPHGKSLCYYCDQHVPDDEQREHFTDEKFELVDGLSDGHQ